VRLSGDEFAAVLPATSFAAAALLAERLQQAVDLFTLRTDDGKVARAGLSVGIAIHPQDGETLEDLMARADVNMYRNKRARRNSRAKRSPNVVPFPVQSPGNKA
jgi:diguanylate cyclase (GGDEF)-like protein